MTAECILDNLLKEAEFYGLGDLVQKLKSIQIGDNEVPKYILAVSAHSGVLYNTSANWRNLHQVWRILKNSKTIHPIDETIYNSLLNGAFGQYVGLSRAAKNTAVDSLRQAGYTISGSWCSIHTSN
jgi:hypothetical protein